jgi:sarcosine oxidase
VTIKRHYDVIVVGLGAMGSATLFHLARRGVKVLGLEQFSPGHTLGSSHGDSRIIREMYFEHPLYVPLVQRAYELWAELEGASGTRLMTISGGLMIGPKDGAIVSGTLRSARTHGLPSEVLDPSEVKARFPAFSLGEALVAVVDPRAGFLDPEACNRAHIALAERAGADTRFNARMLSWEADANGIGVKTSDGNYSADRLLLAAGAWTSEVAGFDLPLVVERQSVFWLDPAGDHSHYDVGSFPIYAYEYVAGNIVYGFPRQSRGVKASVMHAGETARTPEELRRPAEASEADALRDALRPVLPRLAKAPLREMTTCLFTNTPDHDFVIDFHPDHPHVLVSSPCSGHGFKFASAIGELQADLLTTASTSFDLTPFSIKRFSAPLSK